MIDIRFGYLFPWHIRLVALVTLLAAFAIPSLYGTIVLFLAGVFPLVSSEGTEFNIAGNTYREYTSYMFVKSGKFNPLPAVEKLFLTKGKESQKIYTAHTNQSMNSERVVHNAYLKLSTGEKVQLLREADKEKITKKLTPLADALRVDIVDHS